MTKNCFCKWWLITGILWQTFVALFISVNFEATSSVRFLREFRSLLSSIRQQFLCMILTLSHNFAISVLKWLICNKHNLISRETCDRTIIWGKSSISKSLHLTPLSVRLLELTVRVSVCLLTYLFIWLLTTVPQLIGQSKWGFKFKFTSGVCRVICSQHMYEKKWFY